MTDEQKKAALNKALNKALNVALVAAVIWAIGGVIGKSGSEAWGNIIQGATVLIAIVVCTIVFIKNLKTPGV